MRAKKFAISIPQSVMREVDHAARTRGWTRSRFIANVLHITARKRTNAEISRAVDALFSDPEIEAEQRETAAAFQCGAARAAAIW